MAETRTEYAIRWQHVDGLADISFVSADMNVPKSALEGTVFKGEIVTRQVTETDWTATPEGNKS